MVSEKRTNELLNLFVQAYDLFIVNAEGWVAQLMDKDLFSWINFGMI